MPEPQPLVRKDLKPVVYVMGDLAGERESPVYAILQMDAALGEIDRAIAAYKKSVELDPENAAKYSEDILMSMAYGIRGGAFTFDEVDKEGASKISKIEGNVTPFPMPIYTPSDTNS